MRAWFSACRGQRYLGVTRLGNVQKDKRDRNRAMVPASHLHRRKETEWGFQLIEIGWGLKHKYIAFLTTFVHTRCITNKLQPICTVHSPTQRRRSRGVSAAPAA